MTKSAPVQGLTFSEKSHRYKLDGKPVPGVTTLIGKGYPKPGLPYWAAKVVAEYVEANFDQVRADYSSQKKYEFIQNLKSKPWEKRDEAAVRGTEVHALAERVAHGEEVEVPEDLAPYVQGYAQWLDDNNVVPLLTEARVANRSLWYAGTTDLIATVKGKPMLLDLKTSNAIHGNYALQCAAYAHAEFYLDEDNAEQPLPLVEGIGCVHVTAEGSYLVEFPEPETAWTLFTHIAYVAKYTTTIDSWGEDKK